MKLRGALVNLSTHSLHIIGQAHGFDLTHVHHPDDLLEKLEGYLLSPQRIEIILGQLSAMEREALEALIIAGGKMPAALFVGDYGTVPYGGLCGISESQPASPAEELARKGLIYRSYEWAPSWSGDVVFIPDDLLAILPKVEKPKFSSILTPVPQPEHVMPCGDLTRDIGMLICYLQRETIRTVYGDRLSKRDLLRLNTDMSLQEDLSSVRTEDDAPRISFIHHIALSLGIVQAQTGSIIPSRKAEQWLKKQKWQQIQEAWDCYRKDTSWNDATNMVEVRNSDFPLAPAAIVSARTHVLAALKLCPVQTWLSLVSLNKAMKTHNPLFLRARSDRSSSSYYNAALSYGGWDQIEGRLIRTMLNGALRWFGIVEVGGDTTAQLSAFRITAQGAALLGLSQTLPPQPESKPIVVQANFEVIVPRETSPFILFHLQRITKLTKRDRASVYILSRDAVWRYLQAGGQIERVIAFLEYASGRPLPQNVEYSLREWGTKHSEMIIEQVTLLRTVSASLMKEIRSNKKIALAVKEEISPCAVTLANNDLVQLIEQLRRAGYLPKTGEGILSPQLPTPPTNMSLSLTQDTLTKLLAAAVALQGICELQGWEAPVSDRIIQNTLWRLPPSLAKQVQQLAAQVIARYQAEVAELGKKQQ